MADNEHQSPWLTLEEAAAYIRVSERTMRNLVAKEQVTAYRVAPNGALRFKAGDLDGAMEPVSRRHAVLRDIDYPVLAELWDNPYDDIFDELYGDRKAG
ncbi:MAG: helix-turn-helix domain-containing protein [Dehalococcoidia bacterium]